VSAPLPVPEPIFAEMVRVRRDLHRHPELSWGEHRTVQVLEAELLDMGIACHRVAETGLVADLPGPEGVPIVALRADSDALPIQEETGLAFASVHDGVMHACGHDGHSSMLLGAAAMLKDQRLAAPVRLLWQPAEEKAAGAKALIDAGVLDGVGMIFGGHVDRHYRAGLLVVTDGAVNASTDTFAIEIQGQDAHGARPHDAIDAIVVGSLMIMAIQTIVSREVNPAYPSVVTVGSFQAGHAPNVIAGQARIAGTIRAQHPEVRAQLCSAITRIARSVGELHGATVTVDLQAGTPPLHNEALPTSVARDAAEAVVGSDGVVPLAFANMGGEDFAFYLDHVPGCYIRFGAQVPGREGFPAHSSRFDFDEQALATGAAWFVEVARQGALCLAAETSAG
jgi:amidohydrolase